ncbi:MAG: bifunctional uridylyltransferase/uridylyl-removing protein GlnD [Chthoniobacterales bacterium]
MNEILKKKSHHERVFEKDFTEFSKQFLSQQEISLEKIKKFYNNQEKRLKRWHASGGSGKEITGHRSDLIDILFKNIFVFFSGPQQKPLERLCAIALGGYGRGEMNPYSDVDIMFLYEEKKLIPEKEQMISSILMTLWDLGLKVGHSTRSLEEALSHANKEMISKTAMLESRLIAGDKKTFQKFQQKFRKKCILGQEKKYIAWRLENIHKLREKFGKSVFMQEPHIKSGSGGLRDYQNLLWISIFYHKEASLDYLIEKKFLSQQEKKILEKNYDFLLRVRNEMNYQEKRANDQLTLRLQGKIASRLGYTQRNIIRRSEAFMKNYYERTRETNLITSAVLARMRLLSKKEEILFGLQSLFNIKKRKVEKIDGFLIQEDFLFPEHSEIFSDPTRIMKSFHIAQTRVLQFSAELSDLLRKHLPLVNHHFQKSPEARKIFLNILSRKGEVGRILRLMHELGFLGKYIPEFGALTCLVQHEFYHLYTADEHTLISLEKIDSLLFPENQKLLRYSSLFKNLDDPAILYLAMLLHDTGKAANVSNHTKASVEASKKVALRLQLSEERSNLLITLVKLHGELATVARTRDLEDFTTITNFAHQIKKIPTLDALTILTLADGMGTSDTQWSDWKEQLVWSLYDQTKKYLEASELSHHNTARREASGQTALRQPDRASESTQHEISGIGKTFFEQNHRDRMAIQKLIREMLPEDFKQEIDVHFEQMPERYFRMREPSLIKEHLQLFRSFFENETQNASQKKHPLAAEILWREYPESGYTEVSICGWDRRQLLERIAASFLAAGINILSADIFTRRDHVTLDIFRVTSVRTDPLLTEKEKKMMERRLQDLLKINGNQLEDRFNKKRMDTQRMSDQEKSDTMIPSNLFIDNQSHPIYTLVEVETADRQGLFYDLLGALHYRDISIDCARIATEMRAAFDTFYILGVDKKKVLNQEILNNLRERLLAAI